MDSPPKFNIMYVIIIFNNVFMFISDTLVTPPVISNIPFMITERVLFKCNISFIIFILEIYFLYALISKFLFFNFIQKV